MMHWNHLDVHIKQTQLVKNLTQVDKCQDNEKKRGGYRYLRSEGRIKLLGEEVVVEVVDGEGRLGELAEEGLALAEQEGLLHDPLGVGVGAVAALRLGHEAAELVGGHVGRALGVGGEGRPHVRRRLRLARPEPPREAEAAGVAPHSAIPPPPSPLPPSPRRPSSFSSRSRGGRKEKRARERDRDRDRQTETGIEVGTRSQPSKRCCFRGKRPFEASISEVY